MGPVSRSRFCPARDTVLTQGLGNNHVARTGLGLKRAAGGDDQDAVDSFPVHDDEGLTGAATFAAATGAPGGVNSDGGGGGSSAEKQSPPSLASPRAEQEKMRPLVMEVLFLSDVREEEGCASMEAFFAVLRGENPQNAGSAYPGIMKKGNPQSPSDEKIS